MEAAQPPPLPRPICHPAPSRGACPERSPAMQDSFVASVALLPKPSASIRVHLWLPPAVPSCHPDRSGGTSTPITAHPTLRHPPPPSCHPDRSRGACPERSPAMQDAVERNLNTRRTLSSASAGSRYRAHCLRGSGSEASSTTARTEMPPTDSSAACLWRLAIIA